MGIYDRDYYRPDQQSAGFHLGGQRSMVTNLIIINAAIFLIDIFTSPPTVDLQGQVVEHWRLVHLLGLDADLFSQPWKFWQLLTYGFAHAPFDQTIFHVLFNMYALWLFGRDVEGVYGPKEFLRIYLSLVVLAGFSWLVIQSIFGSAAAGLVGASGAVAGILVLFVLHFPHRTFYLLFLPGVPIPAWVLGVVIIGMDIVGSLGGGRGNVAYTAHLAGAAFAFLYYHSHINLGRLLPGRFSFSLNRLKPRPRLRVHDPEDNHPQVDEQADRILDKLHRQGETSLSAKERRILEEYSRRMRQKHR